MAWKPKEKELTREEAVTLAKKELAPYWIGSSPLFTAVNGIALPLSPDFENLSWLIGVADPTRFDGESAAAILAEFQKRYSAFGFSSLLILRVPYAPFRERPPAELFIRRMKLNYPVCIDPDGRLASVFGAGDKSRFSLLHGNNVIFSLDGDPISGNLEMQMQKHLRTLDAGLALPVYFKGSPTMLTDQDVVHGAALSGFEKGKDGFGHLIAGNRASGRVELHGQWIQDAERIATSDANATVSFDAAGAKRVGSRAISIVAQSLSKSGEPARIELQAAGTVIFDAFGGPDLSFDEEGRSIVRVAEARNYLPIRNLPIDRSRITLRFPTADQVPIAIYGLRIGTPYR